MVKTMCDSLIHGGPDDGGVEAMGQEHVVLGNRRLALQDLSAAGHQPMHYRQRYSITYNGELYNFPQLKLELEKTGHYFRNHTDTEVILAAFAQWNTRAFEKFNGMFAFALWDAEEQQLFLVRDAAGMKPLYYSTQPEGICFASEIRAMKTLPFLKEADPEWKVHLLAYGHIPEPITTLKDVRPLPKGCFISYNYGSSTMSLQSYKHYSYSDSVTSPAEVRRCVRELMVASVDRHLISDAPIGVFLSGGLDSSVVAAAASAAKKSAINTFSLYFEEEEFSEKKYQDEVLKTISCNAYQHLLTAKGFNEDIYKIIADMDMPGCDGINTWFISKLARESGVKAVLSGIGGDELFGGYPSFQRMNLALKLQKLPDSIKRSGKYSNIKSLRRLPYLSLPGIKGLYLFLRGYFTPVEIAKQLDATEQEIWNSLEELPVFNKLHIQNDRNLAGWMEFNLYLQNQLLRDADVMGMAHSVEIRVPFLDDELVGYLLRVHPDVKYGGRFKKQLLIDSFHDMIPRIVYDRPKMGFTLPFAKWLSQNKNMMSATGNKMADRNKAAFLSGKMHWSQFLLSKLAA